LAPLPANQFNCTGSCIDSILYESKLTLEDMPVAFL
jgi:hypothetical protein